MPEVYKIFIPAMLLFGTFCLLIYLVISRLYRKLVEKDLEFIRHIIEAQEKERISIAQEIHDNLGPTLSIVQMQVNFLEENPGKENAVLLLPKIQKQLHDAIHLCRDVSHTLSPDLGKDSDLKMVLNHYAETINQTGRLHITFECSDDVAFIDSVKGTSVVRIIQELVTNTLKHACAKHAKIIMRNEGGQFIIQYSDDGKGMPQKLPETGMGLRNIEKRIQILKGKISRSAAAPVKGMHVQIKIPLNHLNA